MDRFHTSEHIGGVTSISAWMSPRRLGLCYAARQNYSADLPLAHLQNTTEKSHVEAQSAICTCATMLHAPGLKRLSHGRRFQRFYACTAQTRLCMSHFGAAAIFHHPPWALPSPYYRSPEIVRLRWLRFLAAGKTRGIFSYTNVGLPVIFSG